MANTILGRTGNIMDVRLDGAAAIHKPEEVEAFGWTTLTLTGGTDLAANETALLVTNDSTTKHLHITQMYIYSDVPSAFDFHCPVYGTFTGTAVTGVALNRSSTTIAPATAYADETGSALANIFATLYSNETAGDQHAVKLNLDGMLILGFHNSAAIAIVANPALVNAAIVGYFHTNHK